MEHSPTAFDRIAGVILGLSTVLASGCGSGSEHARAPITDEGTPTPTASPSPVTDIVAEGARLFTEETFEGNGRTCATCHPAEAHFTLTPTFIASLPPDDPLFVAEHDPALAGLENSDLLRSRALILENVDGFDRPPVFRGVPQILNLAFTAPFGWDGSVPTLADLTVRAIVQHFPRTLARVPGVDFRMPTDAELEALVAFMKSLSPSFEDLPDVFSLSLTPEETRGRDLFFGDAKCTSCHGGPLLTDNLFFATGVTARPISRTPPPECDPPCGPIGPLEADGFRVFNTPALVGLANSAPFFHDNSAATLRDAVDHYRTPAFNESFGGFSVGGIIMTDTEVDAITAFLAALE